MVPYGISASNAYHYKGRAFTGVSTLAHYIGVNYMFFVRRFNKGLTIEEAIKEAEDFVANKVKREVRDHNGRKFNSIKDMCEHHGIDYSVFKSRRILGWVLEDILTTPVYGRSSHEGSLVVKGKVYDSYAHLARESGISYATVISRVRTGVPRDMLTAPLSKSSGVALEHDGHAFKSVREFSDFYGLPYSKTLYRIRDRGQSPSEVIDVLKGDVPHENKE